MIDDIYNKLILQHAAHISKIGHLQNPDATSKKQSRLCGSTITVDLKVNNGIVTDFAHDVKACALGQASASIMAKYIIGTSTNDLKKLQKAMWDMLVNNGPAPTHPFEEFACLQPVKDYKARHGSTMLTFDAVVDCIEQIETTTNV